MNETEPSEPPSSPSAESSPDDETPGRQHGDTDTDTAALSLELADRSGGLDAAVFERLGSNVRTVLAHTSAAGEVRVEIVGDAAMAEAHAEYLGVEGTTDVITFDLMGGASAPPPEGESSPLDVDIMICADEATRQAGEIGHTVEDEMTLYILHGVLHCLGYDDTTEEGFTRMHAEEDRLLTAAGLGALFARANAERGER